MKRKALQFITTGLLLVMGFLPLYAETVLGSTTHARIISKKQHFVFGDMIHYLFHPVAVSDLVIAATMAAALLLILFLTWQMRSNLLPLSAFVLMLVNVFLVFTLLPAIFESNATHSEFERLSGFYIMAVLLLLYDVITVYLLVKAEKDK